MYSESTGAEAGMFSFAISLHRYSHLPVMGHIHYVPSTEDGSAFIFIKSNLEACNALLACYPQSVI